MTLNEMAYELRKTLRFKWLALDYTGYITLWNARPKYCKEKYREDWTSEKMWRRGNDPINGICGYIFPYAINRNLDLSEYKDENGNIDYSKCIVEVE